MVLLSGPGLMNGQGPKVCFSIYVKMCLIVGPWYELIDRGPTADYLLAKAECMVEQTGRWSNCVG